MIKSIENAYYLRFDTDKSIAIFRDSNTLVLKQ